MSGLGHLFAFDQGYTLAMVLVRGLCFVVDNQ